MPNILNEGNYIADIVKYEPNDEYSRETITVASGSGKLSAGTVLEVANTGKYSPLSYTAAANSDPAKVGTPAAVLIKDVDATSADAVSVAVVRNVIVVEQALIWPEDIDATSKASASADLVSLGIVIRKGE